MTERWMNLGDLFDWTPEDPLELYPFVVRVLAVDYHPERHPELLELGKPVIDLLYGRSTWVPRQVKYGLVTLYFPERWLSVHEKAYLMQSLVDLHDDYPLKEVNIITGEPIFLTDCTGDMVRVIREGKPF